MRIAHINAVSFGSTGNIMLQIAETARENGHDVFTFSPYPFSKTYQKLPISPKGHMYFGTWSERRIHNLLGRVFGWDGFFSRKGTKTLIKKLRQNKVELIHIHNIHGYCINIPMLFDYIKRNNIRVVWTLHDCWTFTGHCAHYEVAQCYKWKKGCMKCPQIREYPQSLLDNSRLQYQKKKEWFLNINNDVTLVTPSTWLSNQVKQSFMNAYYTQVINNGIDLSVFQYIENDFREKYNCKDKYIILGVSYGWGTKKGLDVFIELSKRLNSTYQIVLVGTSDKVDLKLPSNIISIHRTQSQIELAKIYSVADVFVNPTREEVLGLVNIEALACGTPVITFDAGGSPECIDETCGVVVEKDDIDKMLNEIVRVCRDKPFDKSDCRKQAEKFDRNKKYGEYVDLYEKNWDNNSLL